MMCACVHVCMYVCMYVCMQVYTCAYVHVCMCACVYVCMCACVHVIPITTQEHSQEYKGTEERIEVRSVNRKVVVVVMV